MEQQTRGKDGGGEDDYAKMEPWVRLRSDFLWPFFSEGLSGLLEAPAINRGATGGCHFVLNGSERL